ncbi:MAG TPA: ABC transporter permease [Chitinophagaceae bacterium]|nr:ABC transporter permease [Chitinophagaceae bacterium]
MLRNYFKTFFRNLWKTRGYSFLNIGGLGIGIACASLIFLWVEDELTYNDYFKNKADLYRVKDRQTYDGTTFTFDATPGPFARGIKTEIPGIKNTARTTWGNTSLFSLDDKSIYKQGLYADSSFTSMFHLHFIKGDPAKPFSQLYSLVISKSMAENFFGTDDVIGRTLRVDNSDGYMVSGVFEDLPQNVSFKFDWLAPFKIYEDRNQWLQQWGNNGVLTYVETEPDADVVSINKKLYGYIQTKAPNTNAKMSIYPMTRWRMYNTFDNGKEAEGRIKYVKLFSLIAWIIIIIACINFMNLSTARSEQRAREVGIRKVAGAGKTGLIGHFIGEAVLMALLSAILAIGFIYLALPAFNTLVEKQLRVHISDPYHMTALLSVALICGLLAGSYPAFYLSSFKPVYVLKGIRIKNNGSAGIIRKGLVVLQFSISIILIIATIIIYQQIVHAKTRDLGYNKDNLVEMNLQGNMKARFGVIKNDLQSAGIIENAALSNSQVLSLGNNTGDFTWEGKDPSKQVLITVEGVSPEYISTMGMKLVRGRDFYPDGKTDSSNVIINESFAGIIKTKNILGSVLNYGNQKLTVVGVIKDFVYNDMYAPASPLVLYSDTSGCNFLTARLNKGIPVSGALSKMEALVKKDNPGYPFQYDFIDTQFGNLFKTETLISRLAEVFSVLAIVISCLGLFGLAAYTAEKRTKEVGIRKVLGASTQGLAALLSKDFLLLVIISCIIAFPVAGWIMNNWLDDQQYRQYRIHISWWVFVLAGLLAIIIALLTVSYQAIKAAIANPVKSLRTE